MKIWKLGTDTNKYDFFVTKEDILHYRFDGNSIKDRWKAIEVYEHEKKKRCDKPTFFMMVFRFLVRKQFYY